MLIRQKLGRMNNFLVICYHSLNVQALLEVDVTKGG